MKWIFLLLCAVGSSTAAPTTPRPERPGRETISTAPDSGGATTVLARGKRAYSLPLANISPENLRLNTLGNSFFNENWVAAPGKNHARDGLGPLFHARSCSACHLFDGRGAPMENDKIGNALLFRLSIPGEGMHGAPLGDPIYGGQLAPHALPVFDAEGEVDVRFESVSVTFADGSTKTLQKPIYSVARLNYGEPSAGLMIGPRLAPAVFGLGLLEAVPEEKIVQWVDAEDADGDGISGRVNRVWNPVTQREELGRFGWKANASSLRMQSAEAAVGDMGLTSTVEPKENHTDKQGSLSASVSGGPLVNGAGPELADEILDSLTIYLQTLAPPARRESFDLTVRRGQVLFHQVKCAVCHRATLSTGEDASILPELRSLVIRPYTDLLLHDMGPELADGRPDFLASGAEWRTPPLWGIGLSSQVNGHACFMHDGRARDLEEAILWHGGEADGSRQAFLAMPKTDREALLKFINSL
jgi:CxxC motif-containing protein (DUF1111 family)